MEATDGNNDILMSEEIDASNEDFSADSSADSTSESAIRIQRLHGVEKVPTDTFCIELYFCTYSGDVANSAVNPDIWQCHCCTF